MRFLNKSVFACVSLAGLVLLAGARLPASAGEQGKSQGTPQGARELLASWLQVAKRGTPEWKALMADGEARTEFCARCHGADGSSAMPLVPNLAGQSPVYLLDQIEQFADGRRNDFIMTPLARRFSTEDKVGVVFYYANLAPRPHGANPELARAGERLYAGRCVACHGRDAHGGDRFARLASQHPQYLKRRLAAFQETTGDSASPMLAVAKGLSAQDMQAIVAYLSTLP